VIEDFFRRLLFGAHGNKKTAQEGEL